MAGRALYRVRPRALLVTSIVVAIVVLGSPVVMWVLLPAEIRAQASGPEILGSVVILLAITGFIIGLGLSEVVADADGIVVRNGLSRYRLGWHEIAGFRFREGDPWAYVYTAATDADGDPRRRMILAIQGTDGDRARLDVARVEELWREHRP